MKNVKLNKLAYRLNANRMINGGKKLIASPRGNSVSPIDSTPVIVVALSSHAYTVMENAGSITVYIERYDDEEVPVSVNYA
jgi:hypothetical protein